MLWTKRTWKIANEFVKPKDSDLWRTWAEPLEEWESARAEHEHASRTASGIVAATSGDGYGLVACKADPLPPKCRSTALTVPALWDRLSPVNAGER